MIADLRGGSPQPPPLPTWQRHGAPAAEPADPAEHEQEEQLQEQEEQLPAAQLPEAQLAGDVAGDGNAPPPCSPPPCSPPEFSSKPREDGADNFPGFWRPPAAEAAGTGASGAAALAAAAGKGSRKRAAGSATGEGAQALQRQRQPSLDDEQMTLRGQGRSRRVSCLSRGCCSWLLAWLSSRVLFLGDCQLRCLSEVASCSSTGSLLEDGWQHRAELELSLI